jgi:hypothetical protein
MLSVHSAQSNVAHIAAWVTGFPLIVGLLNQLTDDLASLTSDWQRVRLVGAPQVIGPAEALVLALCDLLASVDPGWHRPRARAKHRRQLDQAKKKLVDASPAFDSAARADAAPDRRDRKAAAPRR